MSEYSFKVASPWYHQLMVWIPFSMFAFLLIGMGLRVGYPAQSIGMTVVLFLLCVFASLSSGLFCVRVNGETIHVRTSFGKRYKISCTDISKVVCTKRNSLKYGTLFYLTVATQQWEFTLDGQMVGFNAMAEYLLAQLEEGKIKQTAASKTCVQQLQFYQKGIQKHQK